MENSSDVSTWDIYEILDVENGSELTLDQLRRAYRRRAILIHPDKNPDDPMAGERFHRLSEAFKYISTDGNKQVYDESLRVKKTRLQNEHRRGEMERVMKRSLEEREMQATSKSASYTPNNTTSIYRKRTILRTAVLQRASAAMTAPYSRIEEPVRSQELDIRLCVRVSSDHGIIDMEAVVSLASDIGPVRRAHLSPQGDLIMEMATALGAAAMLQRRHIGPGLTVRPIVRADVGIEEISQVIQDVCQHGCEQIITLRQGDFKERGQSMFSHPLPRMVLGPK